MSKKKYQHTNPTEAEISEEALMESEWVLPEEPAEILEATVAVVEEPSLAIEQVAVSLVKGFRSHHLPGILAFARSNGLKVVGSIAEMSDVLRAYGYKI